MPPLAIREGYQRWLASTGTISTRTPKEMGRNLEGIPSYTLAMNITKTISDAVHQELKPIGAKRKSLTWRLHGREVISVLNLQRSQYSPGFYLNVGFWIRQLGDTDTPRCEQCHVQARAEEIWPDYRDEINAILAIENTEQSLAGHAEKIQSFIHTCMIPVFKLSGTVDGLIEILRVHPKLNVMCVAYDILGVGGSESETATR